MCVGEEKKKRRRRRKRKRKERKTRLKGRKNISVCVRAREERNLRQDCGEKEIPGGFFPSCLGRRAAAGWLSGPSYQGNSTEHTE